VVLSFDGHESISSKHALSSGSNTARMVPRAPFVQADEVDTEGAELLQCKHELPQATRKAVVSVNDDGIHEPLPADRHQSVEGWSSFTRAADSLVHILYGDLETPALTELA